MIDPGFTTNINYVTRTVQATKDLILSIEDDIKEVRTMIRHRVTDQSDQTELIQLLELERTQLQSQIRGKDAEVEALQSFIQSLEDEKAQQQESYENEIRDLENQIHQLQQENEEKNEKILLYEAEIERTLKQCNQAMTEKENIFSKAKELDEYCNQVEAQVALYHTQATTLQQEKDTLQKKFQQLEKTNKKKQDELDQEYQKLYQQYLQDTDQLQQQIQAIQQDHQLLGQEKTKVELTFHKNQEEFQSQYNHLYQQYQQAQEQIQHLTQLTQQYNTQLLQTQQNSQQKIIEQQKKYEKDLQTLQQRHKHELQKQKSIHADQLLQLNGRHDEEIQRLSQRKALEFSHNVQKEKEFEELSKSGSSADFRSPLSDENLTPPAGFVVTMEKASDPTRQQRQYFQEGKLSDSSRDEYSVSSASIPQSAPIPASSSLCVSRDSFDDPIHAKRTSFFMPAEERDEQDEEEAEEENVEITELDEAYEETSERNEDTEPVSPLPPLDLTPFVHERKTNRLPEQINSIDPVSISFEQAKPKLENVAHELIEERKEKEKEDETEKNPARTNQPELKEMDYRYESDEYEDEVERERDQRVILSPNRSHRNSLSHEVNHLEIIEEDEQQHIIHARSSDDIVLKAREEYDTNKNISGFEVASRLPTPLTAKKGFFLNPFDEFDVVPDAPSSNYSDSTGTSSAFAGVRSKSPKVDGISYMTEDEGYDQYQQITPRDLSEEIAKIQKDRSHLDELNAMHLLQHDDNDFIDDENIQLSDLMNFKLH